MKFYGRSQPTLWTAVFLFTCFSTIDCTGISCYQCTVAPKPGAKFSTSQICSQFEKTAHFQTYCPNSTLCMKRSIHHRLGNGTLVLTSVERGCTPQLQTIQKYDSNKKSWYTEQKIVTSAYEETCFLGEDRGSPGGPPEYCYCSYHLCNSGLTTKNITDFNILLVITLLWLQCRFQ